MIPNITTVLFDQDGVLTNSEKLIIAAYDHVLAAFGVDKARVDGKAGLGYTLEEVYSLVASGSKLQAMMKAHDSFQREHLDLVSPPVDAISTLAVLRGMGIHTGVITNRSRNARHILDHCGFGELIELVVARENVTQPKPHPEGILKALEHFKANASETMMIGDMASDIKAGQAAGVITIGIGNSVDLAGLKASKPDYIVESLSDLIPWFFKN